MTPKISIIMGIYNCSNTLPEAIESILAQTYTNWELILCDDGSQDETYAVAEAYSQKYSDKIVLLKNGRNMGLNYTLNHCLRYATGEFIARMDGDDLCDPARLVKEIAVLESEPDIAIVSTDMYFFDDNGVWGRVSNPEYPDKMDFLNGTPFCHAPCMVRKQAYLEVGGYSEEKKLLRVEDYHLWMKMYRAGLKGKNIHEPLYSMRDDQNAYQRRKFRYRLNEAYVRYLAVRELKLPIRGYLSAIKPVLIGLLPRPIYDILHKQRLSQKKDPPNC